MDYIEIEIDSSYTLISDSALTPKDNPVVNIGRTLTNIVGAKILEVNIPFSYYAITDNVITVTGQTQNSFYVIFSGAAISYFYVVIPPGNYTATALATEIQTQFVAASVNFPFTGGAPTCTYSATTGKFTFTMIQTTPGFVTFGQMVFSELYDGNPVDLFQFGDTIPLQPLAILLGFTSNVPVAVVTGGVTIFTWAAPSVANVTGPNHLYVNSKILGNICKAYIPESSLVTGETNPQMAMLPVNVNPGGIIWWQDPAPHEVFDTKNLFSLQKLDLYITSGTNPTPLKFNGLGFQVKLLLYVKFPDQGFSQSGTVTQNRAVMQIRPT